MKQCWLSIFKPSLILTSLTGQICQPSLPAKSASQVFRPSLPAKPASILKCPNVKMSNPISGSQIRVPYHPTNRGPKSVLKIEVPNRGPKTGSQIGVRSQMGVPKVVPNGGPKWGSQMGVQIRVSYRGPISPSVLKCQNDKMAKWQNDKTPIGLWSEKVRKLLQGLRA
jgi:hypothetical protein